MTLNLLSDLLYRDANIASQAKTDGYWRIDCRRESKFGSGGPHQSFLSAFFIRMSGHMSWRVPKASERNLCNGWTPHSYGSSQSTFSSPFKLASDRIISRILWKTRCALCQLICCVRQEYEWETLARVSSDEWSFSDAPRSGSLSIVRQCTLRKDSTMVHNSLTSTLNNHTFPQAG